ncbi:MAG: phosphatase PAP2 family protein [Ignavibacteriales bacterium]|nr:phosphatase PAP2 family protein [Ignavibacteriales bacterium]
MTDKTLYIAGFRLRATDALILFTLSLFSVLALLFHSSVQGWWMLIIKNVGTAVVYLALVFASEKMTRKFPRFLLRVAAVTLAYAYLFGAVDKLQLILQGQWMDEYVMDAEQYIFGVQPTLWLQHITTPPLTEWMMFAYVIYVPMYPILCGIIYYLRGDVAMEDYLFTLGFTNILCDIGFILFPVAGPMATIGNLYSVPLKGYVFTFFGELMRSNVHFIGGNIPSPHTAAATIMWVMAYRYHRPSFYILTPVVLSLYVSTFYLRYHFVTDAVVGIIVAFLALLVVPFLIKAWDRFAEKPTNAPTTH